MSDIERGKNKITATLRQLIILEYSINEKFLDTGEQPMFSPTRKDQASQDPGLVSSLRRIPGYGNVPCGIPNRIAEQEPAFYLDVPDVPENCFALRVQGNSMAPLINHGDYLIFVLGNNVKSGDIVIVNNEYGESMAKRYLMTEAGPVLKSENQDYKSYQPNEYYRIVGKVIKSVKVTNF